MATSKESQKRRAKNEKAFRDFNVRTRKAAETVMQQVDKAAFPLGMMCECSDENCTQRLELTIKERENIRENKDYFIVLRGHEDLEIEKIVERRPKYTIVEKLPQAQKWMYA
jgi:hypothetical protein